MARRDRPDGLHPVPAADLLPLDKARNSLVVVWTVGSGPFILILVVQSLIGTFGDKVQDVWGWALPTIMPTLAMIVTVLGYTALDPYSSLTVVRRSFFRVSWWLSLFYLLLILLTILIQPFLPSISARLQAMRVSNLWLGPIQGLVASALGVLFVTKRSKE